MAVVCQCGAVMVPAQTNKQTLRACSECGRRIWVNKKEHNVFRKQQKENQ